MKYDVTYEEISELVRTLDAHYRPSMSIGEWAGRGRVMAECQKCGMGYLTSLVGVLDDGTVAIESIYCRSCQES